jgi:hypothetical protein
MSSRRPHDAIYPEVTCTGEPAEELEWLRLQDQARDMYRDQFPDGCAFCGEPADHEMGEWWDEATGTSKIGHAQCGIDSGLPMA